MARLLDPHSVTITMPDGEPSVEAPNVAVELTPDDLILLERALHNLDRTAQIDPRGQTGPLFNVLDAALIYARPNR